MCIFSVPKREDPQFPGGLRISERVTGSVGSPVAILLPIPGSFLVLKHEDPPDSREVFAFQSG